MTSTDLILEERRWTKLLETLDRGDYQEAPSKEYISTRQVIKAMTVLTDLLLAHERSGYQFPSEAA